MGIKQIISALKRQPSDEPVAFNGQLLPPRHMRLGSQAGKPDQVYLEYAKASARTLQQYGGATPQQRIVDIGCGPGRLLVGMLAQWGEVARYWGLDVDPKAIAWAQRYLAREPQISFHHLNLNSARYNPASDCPPTQAQLPIADAEADLVVLLSVFSHMFMDDIEAYLVEIARVLRPGGRVLLTVFAEDDVERDCENPKDYITDWKGPLHCVRVNRQAFDAAVAAVGLSIQTFDYRKMTSQQSLCVLVKAGRD